MLIKTGKRASRKKGYQKENSDTFREKHDFVVNLRMLGLTIVSEVISFRPPVSFVSRIIWPTPAMFCAAQCWECPGSTRELGESLCIAQWRWRWQAWGRRTAVVEVVVVNSNLCRSPVTFSGG